MLAVDNVVALYIFDCIEPLALKLGKFRLLAHCLEHREVTIACRLIFCVEIVVDIAKTQAVAAHLVGIGGTDALSCGSYFGTALGALVGSVKQSVGGQNQMHLL